MYSPQTLSFNVLSRNFFIFFQIKTTTVSPDSGDLVGWGVGGLHDVIMYTIYSNQWWAFKTTKSVTFPIITGYQHHISLLHVHCTVYTLVYQKKLFIERKHTIAYFIFIAKNAVVQYIQYYPVIQ